MTIDDLAAVVVAEACVNEGVPYMFTGAFATGLYGSPRSTADVDVDVVADIAGPTAMSRLLARLTPVVSVDTHMQFARSPWAADESA